MARRSLYMRVWCNWKHTGLPNRRRRIISGCPLPAVMAQFESRAHRGHKCLAHRARKLAAQLFRKQQVSGSSPVDGFAG